MCINTYIYVYVNVLPKLYMHNLKYIYIYRYIYIHPVCLGIASAFGAFLLAQKRVRMLRAIVLPGTPSFQKPAPGCFYKFGFYKVDIYIYI